jgi:isoleucyl-tRNA synthetase
MARAAPVCPVDGQGKFTKEAGKYFGLTVKKDDSVIIDDLKGLGALLEVNKISHRYGHCWRCKSPIIYRSTKQWFIKITALKEKMLDEIQKVDWVPEWAGSSRFRDWIENSRDWTISRQRYWGIPIWICEECSKLAVIGSKDELTKKGGRVRELHKPFVDEIAFPCDCKGSMKRVPDVLDVWFDSGVAAWASLGYPSREDEFEWYPADLIAEGHDQTRGWFYSLLGCGLIAFDEIPYKRVLMHGFTLDEKGNKMSKSLGNVVNPEDVIKRYGVDVLRYYVLWANKPWDDLKFNWSEVDIVKRMFNILWNVYVFSTTYMSIDGFVPHKPGKGDELYKKEDLWILSRFNSVSKLVIESYESLNLFGAVRAIEEFVLEDLSRWYVPLIRHRTWIEKDAPEKLAAYNTLWEVFRGLSILMAPITPHLSEEIYQNLISPFSDTESVHLESMISPDAAHMDPVLESHMAVVKKFVEAVFSAREKRGIKRRWPLKEIVFLPGDQASAEALQALMEIALAQANTKNIEITHSIKDSLISDEKRFLYAEFENGKLYIDCERSDDIIKEGFAREVVRRIQQMRKEQDLDVEAYIEVNIEIDDRKIPALLEDMRNYISNETRAKGLYINGKHKKFIKSWNIESKKFIISIGK